MNTSQDLQEAVGRLATSLETPVVPGELPGWIATVHEAFVPVDGFLGRNVRTVQASEYRQIVREDPDLSPQVEQLKQGDEESLRRLDELRTRIEQLKHKVPKRGPDEASLNGEIQALVDQGLAFVILVQKQDVASRTWLQEAFNRDRGVGD